MMEILNIAALIITFVPLLGAMIVEEELAQTNKELAIANQQLVQTNKELLQMKQVIATLQVHCFISSQKHCK